MFHNGPEIEMADTAQGDMPVLLLAAGFGTRLRPLTSSIPKCLVPIGGAPLLGRWLDQLGTAGLGPFIVNMHYRAEQVQAYLANSPWHGRIIADHEDVLLGTAGTVRKHANALANGSFMVVHADNLSCFDVKAFRLAHARRPCGCVMTMMSFHTPTPQGCGIIEVDGQGVVQAFHEKVLSPPGNLANGAVYIMEPEVLRVIAACEAEQSDLSVNIIPQFVGRIATFLNGSYHRDIGTPESYAQALIDVSSWKF